MKMNQKKEQNHLVLKPTKKLIYDDTNHLNELIKEIVSLHKEDGYDKFEEISLYIKQKMTKLTLEYEPYPYIPKKLMILTPKEEKIIQEKSQIKVPKVKEVQNYMEDILLHASILEWIGINFNQTEWYKIRMAMKKLLIENKCEYIRFFGKIYGINSDYYIIQGIVKDYPMKNPPKHVESRGNEGINRYTFWVSDSLLEYWNELPDITHEQLRISRLFKYIFTGDLNSKVKSQKLSENYKDQLEGKIIEYDEEYKPLSFEEMKDPEFANWTHEYAYIYPSGKVIDPSVENQIERMKGIGEDEGYKIKEGEGEEVNEIDAKYWKVKVVGDNCHTRKRSNNSCCYSYF